MTATLLAHQLRFDLLALRRNRRMQLFGVALPLVLLVTFAGLFDATPVEVAGHMVPADRASVPGIMGLAVLTSSFMALAITVVTQRQLGVLKRRRSTPCPAWVLVASRALAAMLSSVVACAVMAVVAGAGYGFDLAGSGNVAALLAIVVGSLCFASCAFLVASLVSTPEAAQPLLQLVMLPLQLISGIYFPASQMPGWLQGLADAFPLVHLTNALQHAWLPSGGEIAWGDLGVMALWAMAAGWGAARTFKWLPKPS
jgi:ABC-2 type transport system permease protein